MSRNQKSYNGEFKQQVIEDMLENKLGYNETRQKYGLSNGRVQLWERIYLEDGVEGLYVERRGRASAASGTQKGRPAKLPKATEEDLLAEVQRLRAEVDYLKNLQALVLKRQHRKNGQK